MEMSGQHHAPAALLPGNLTEDNMAFVLCSYNFVLICAKWNLPEKEQSYYKWEEFSLTVENNVKGSWRKRKETEKGMKKRIEGRKKEKRK
jgi:hypothetical protein